MVELSITSILNVFMLFIWLCVWKVGGFRIVVGPTGGVSGAFAFGNFVVGDWNNFIFVNRFLYIDNEN